MNSYWYIGGAALAAGLGLWWATQEKKKAEEAQKAAPPPTPPPVQQATPVQPPQEESQRLEAQVPKALGVVGTVVGGVKLQEALGGVTDRVAGEGAGTVARVVQAGVTPGIIGGKAVQRGLESLGVGNETARVTGVATTAALVLGAPAAVGVASAQLAGNALQAGLRAIAGERVERAVSGVVSQLDPTKPGSVVNTVLSPVAKGVSALASVFGGGGLSAAEKAESARLMTTAKALPASEVAGKSLNQLLAQLGRG